MRQFLFFKNGNDRTQVKYVRAVRLNQNVSIMSQKSNIKNLNGHPLIAWTIASAKKSKLIDDIKNNK